MGLIKESVKEVLVFLLFVSMLTFVSASDIAVFEADILADEPDDPIVSVEVQETVNFGEAEKGRQTSNVRINVTNTGNVGIVVTPRLTDVSEEIFNYTYFQRRTTEPYYKIGIFNFNISAPARLGENKSDYIYAKLDLRNYPNEIPADLSGYSANVKFFAVSQ